MELSTVTFHMDSQPNFDKLKTGGWYHPLGLSDEELKDSLVKEFGDYEIQVVHTASGIWVHTEAYIHARADKLVMKKGEGQGMLREVALRLIGFLYDEMSDK